MAKINRAKEHHESLKTNVNEFLESANKSLTQSSYHSDDGLRVILRATCPLEVNLKISVIAGEIVHQLRSSLDHLLCALIYQAGHSPGRTTQFPICTSRESYEEQVKRGRIKGVSPAAEKLIEQSQPFTNPTPNETIINVVSTLNNWDKHNALVISAAAAQVGQNIEIGGSGAEITAFANPEVIKFEGGNADYFYIQLAKPEPSITVKSSIDLKMAIEVNKDGKIAPLIEVMGQLIAGIEGTIELFKGEFS
ncbi:hypothetical protein [Microcoleus sp.]|uniref:hypothetical protein n=1 Tax=Microcoleus sp. TaxID=44472 RepID=UPI003526A4B9